MLTTTTTEATDAKIQRGADLFNEIAIAEMRLSVAREVFWQTIGAETLGAFTEAARDHALALAALCEFLGGHQPAAELVQ